MDKLDSFITGIGSLAESSRILYKSLLSSGFSDGEALWLTGEYLKTIVSESSKPMNKEEQDDIGS